MNSTVLEIAEFPHSSPIELKSREAFAAAYAHTPPSCADLAFSTLYGWQDYFLYRVSRWKDFLLVHSLQGNRMTFLPPLMLNGRTNDPGWGEAFLELALCLDSYCAGKKYELVFQAFTEQYTRHLPPGRFAVTDDRDNYDYIYRREDLVNLPGRGLAGKRNLVRQFKRNYPSYRYETLNAGNTAAFADFIGRWRHPGAGGNEILGLAAYCMACRLLEHEATLELCGGLLYVEGAVAAAALGSLVRDFSYGDGLSPTVVVHHENALTEYKGVYQMINQQFCEHLPPEVVYINREEDLGLPGLRKAKMSYEPCALVKKCRIALIK